MDDSRVNSSVLSRSLSTPEIFLSPTSVSSVCRRVYVEEVIRVPFKNEPMIRHYSCEQILDAPRNQRQDNICFTLGSMQLQDLKTPNFDANNRFNVDLNKPNLPLEYHSTPKTAAVMHSNYNNVNYEGSPMDVDDSLSNMSKEKLDEVENITAFDANSTITGVTNRRRLRRLNSKGKETTDVKIIPKIVVEDTDSSIQYLGNDSQLSSTTHFPLFFKLIAFIFCAIICVKIYYDNEFIFADNEEQLRLIKHEMENNVLEQNNPVIIVTKSLEQVNRWPKHMKVLPFVGSSGVGKTHVANLIKKHFHPKLVHEINKEFFHSYTYSEDKKNDLFKTQFKKCCLNLLIIDDLSVVELESVIDFLYTVPDNQSLLVLPIFSVQHVKNDLTNVINYNDYRTVELGFDKSALYHEIVIFNEFDEEAAKKWLLNLIKTIKNEQNNENFDRETNENYGNIKIGDEAEIMDILRNHDVKHKGLKGLYSKIFV